MRENVGAITFDFETKTIFDFICKPGNLNITVDTEFVLNFFGAILIAISRIYHVSKDTPTIRSVHSIFAAPTLSDI